MDAYTELLNASELCLSLDPVPNEGQRLHEATAMRLQFYAVLSDNTSGPTSLDAKSYSKGIDANTIVNYRTMIVPIFIESRSYLGNQSQQ
jgi:hypothetical protein